MTELLHTFLLALAFLALLGVVFEEVIHINKAKVTLFLGTVSWLLMFIFPESEAGLVRIEEGLSESISEIAELWLFL
ncbi:sodium:proton antiporter, partial [Oceanospirillum sp. HFRX-1_2]